MRIIRSCILLSIELTFSIFAIGQKTIPVEISGRIGGSYSGEMHLFFENDYRHKDSLRSEITDGRFHFNCNITTPILGRLHLGGDSYIVDFFIDGKKIFLDCVNKKTVINSSTDTMNILTLIKATGSEMEKEKEDFLHHIHIDNAADIYRVDSVKFYKELLGFVDNHLKSKVSPYLISFSSNLSYAQLAAAYEKLDPSLVGCYEMKSAKELIETKERSDLGLLNEGMPFHNVALPDLSGRITDTRRLAGDYVLIVCWASWCGPCRAESPALRNLFDRYGSRGLKMVGISFDQSETKWREAVRKDTLSWTQLIDARGFNGDFSKYYGLEGIPLLILLDKDKKVVLTGTMEEMNGKITSLFK